MPSPANIGQLSCVHYENSPPSILYTAEYVLWYYGSSQITLERTLGEVLEGHVCGLLNGCWSNPFPTVESMCFAFTATCILDLEDEEKLP